MILLTRIEAARNMRRFYAVHVVPNLFGEWAVLKEWGRIGRAGTVRTWTFTGQGEAEQARQRSIGRKLRRGYVMQSTIRHDGD